MMLEYRKSAFALVAALFLASTAQAGKPALLTNIPLVWKPTTSISKLGVVNITGLSGRTIRLDRLADGRLKQDLIGENREDESEGRILPVTTSADVPAFLTAHIRYLLDENGISTVAGGTGGDLVISGSVKRFFVEETSTYQGEVMLVLSVADARGTILWEGVVSGRARHFGSSYKAEELLRDSQRLRGGGDVRAAVLTRLHGRPEGSGPVVSLPSRPVRLRLHLGWRDWCETRAGVRPGFWSSLAAGSVARGSRSCATSDAQPRQARKGATVGDPGVCRRPTGIHVGPALSRSTPEMSEPQPYRVLALKHRPQTFDQVVGQDVVVRTLKNALTRGRIGHAFLLSGTRGVGKTTVARILAKALNCTSAPGPTPTPCLECASCREIAAGTSIDVQEIDGASNNSVDDVRELRESARYNPARDRFRIWIIDEVHMLSGAAFNALLKTLEEPPPRVKFLFATTDAHKLPETILSRCQQHTFQMVPARDIEAHLRAVAGREGIAVSEASLARIARAAEGSVRDALSLFDQVLAFSGSQVQDPDVETLLGLVSRELLTAASQAVLENDALGLLRAVESLADRGADYRTFTRELLLHFREILLAKLAPEDSSLLAQLVPEERERLRPLAQAYSEEDLLRSLEILTRVEVELRASSDPRITLELALLKLAQLRRLMPFAELVARVERLAGGAPAAPRRALPGPKAAAVSPARAPAAAAVPPAADLVPPAVAEDGLLGQMLALATTRPSLAQPLRAARAQIEGDTLLIEVPADFVAFAALHAEEYRELASKAAGRPLKVRVGASGPAPAQPAPASDSEQARKERLMLEAGREPAVQEALDLFGGRVVDVREVES